MQALDENGNQVTGTAVSYDAHGYLLKQWRANESRGIAGDLPDQSQSYDGEGRVSSLTYPAGHATDYSYGALSGFMTQMTYPQGDNIQYQQYDPWAGPCR